MDMVNEPVPATECRVEIDAMPFLAAVSITLFEYDNEHEVDKPIKRETAPVSFDVAYKPIVLPEIVDNAMIQNFEMMFSKIVIKSPKSVSTRNVNALKIAL